MHSSTKKWKAPRVKAREEGQRRLKGRKYLCPESPFFTEHFNFQQQETIMLKEKEMYLERHEPVIIPVAPFGGKIFAPLVLEVFNEDYQYSDSTSMEGKFLQTSCSPVLCMSTVWQEDFERNKYFVYPANAHAISIVALFPGIQELKFEGNDRIASSIDHRRFLPFPRHPCNQTVNWTVRPYLKPHQFDEIMENHAPTKEDIFFYDWEIGLPDDEDLQIGLSASADNKDDDFGGHGMTNSDPYNGVKATRLLGHELLTALDPQNVYF
ncbi:hypothetical protein QM012_002060 [Aureobasidium pullulans]|uniref:Uncharacterized protein n=1 Tax=Aureobasidium pullulans TaxID=5580 RepID=A0ABR0TE39_AURPU